MSMERIHDQLTSYVVGATGIFCGVNWDLMGSRCLTALSTLLVVVRLVTEYRKWRKKHKEPKQ